MGTETNNEQIENEKINEDDIIENDCYEEIDMRKINQIIEKEKQWNNNTIIYSNNIINISNIDIENENEQNLKQNEVKEKDNTINIEEKEKKKEEEKKEEKDNIKKESSKNNNNNNSKNAKKILHVMPKIKPKNTSDEVLNREIVGNKEKKNEINIIPETSEKIMKKEEKNEQQKNLNIQNIIPKNKLTRLKEDEIIYSGTLEKILNIPESKKITYSKRFCVLTKKYFAYYKSKESFISLNKPMFVIENNDIIRTENTFLDGEGYFGIICDVNERTRNLIYRVNSFVTKEENNSQLLLGFRSNNYEEMTKWLILLNYFISERNNNI